MSDIPLVLQTAYAELVERCWSSRMRTEFSAEGSFIERKIGNRSYWYFRQTEKDGKRKERYVGPRGDELDRMVANHGLFKDDWWARRKIVTALIRAGLAAPATSAGRILNALSEAGVFRLRAVLIGTTAFQIYPAVIGKKFNLAHAQTADLDVAQFSTISLAVKESINMSFLDVLRSVDPTFTARPRINENDKATTYVSKSFRVDVLTPKTGPDSDEPVMLPALKTHATALRYLDFLIYEEIKAAVLYGAGVPVNIPSPERFALHKLLVSRARHESSESQTKARKDIAQANSLILALAETRPYELRDAWWELRNRGPKWRKLADEAVSMLSDRTREALSTTIHANEDFRP